MFCFNISPCSIACASMVWRCDSVCVCVNLSRARVRGCADLLGQPGLDDQPYCGNSPGHLQDEELAHHVGEVAPHARDEEAEEVEVDVCTTCVCVRVSELR